MLKTDLSPLLLAVWPKEERDVYRRAYRAEVERHLERLLEAVEGPDTAIEDSIRVLRRRLLDLTHRVELLERGRIHNP